MADQLTLQPGALPWRPTDETELEQVFHKYDRPLAGIVKQRGNLFFFTLVEDVFDEWSVWAYVLVEPKDVDRLRDRTTTMSYLEETATHPVFLAIAKETAIVFTATAPPPAANGSFLASVLRSLEMATGAFRELDGLSA
jgi:hypothetical protein